MISVVFVFGLLHAQCSATTCPVPPASTAVQSKTKISTLVEVRSRQTKRLVHRAAGPLVFGKKHNVPGHDLRDLGFDAPIYEIRSELLEDGRVWLSA